MKANPAPLGLLGFALTTALLQGAVTSIADEATTFLVFGYAFAFGGAAQALAGIILFQRERATLPAVAFVCYGAFWIGFAINGTLTAAGIYHPAHDGEKMLLSLWGGITFFFFCASLAVNFMLQSLFLLLSVVFFLLAGGVANGNSHKAAGWIGLVVSGIAFYGGVAELLNEMYEKTILPLGVCNPAASLVPRFQSVVGAIPLLGAAYLRAVEAEDALAGYGKAAPTVEVEALHQTAAGAAAHLGSLPRTSAKGNAGNIKASKLQMMATGVV